MAVVGRAFLMAVGLAHRAIHVQDELGELAVLAGLVDPWPERSIRCLRLSLVLRVSVSKRAISLVEAAWVSSPHG